MSTLTITIDMDNAAFEYDAGREAARILRGIATKVEETVDAGDFNIRDINGNTVGSVEVTA